mmetsp:Transcript_56194/g.67420  ORF Transcript_56194/g.67420 Transcript_56194/m.67420 type:complete len:86 (+) Transcript_56194:183-440(+)
MFLIKSLKSMNKLSKVLKLLSNNITKVIIMKSYQIIDPELPRNSTTPVATSLHHVRLKERQQKNQANESNQQRRLRKHLASSNEH